MVLTVIFDLLDLIEGLFFVLPLTYVFVDSDSDDSDDFALADVVYGVSALSGLITPGAEDQSVEPFPASELFVDLYSCFVRVLRELSSLELSFFLFSFCRHCVYVLL